MRVERGLGNNLVCEHSPTWDICKHEHIANTKLMFKLSVFQECISINEILRSKERQVGNICYLLWQVRFSEWQGVFTKGLLLPLWNPQEKDWDYLEDRAPTSAGCKLRVRKLHASSQQPDVPCYHRKVTYPLITSYIVKLPPATPFARSIRLLN